MNDCAWRSLLLLLLVFFLFNPWYPWFLRGLLSLCDLDPNWVFLIHGWMCFVLSDCDWVVGWTLEENACNCRESYDFWVSLLGCEIFNLFDEYVSVKTWIFFFYFFVGQSRVGSWEGFDDRWLPGVGETQCRDRSEYDCSVLCDHQTSSRRS